MTLGRRTNSRLWLILPREYEKPYPTSSSTVVATDAHRVFHPNRSADRLSTISTWSPVKKASGGTPGASIIGPGGGWKNASGSVASSENRAYSPCPGAMKSRANRA